MLRADAWILLLEVIFFKQCTILIYRIESIAAYSANFINPILLSIALLFTYMNWLYFHLVEKLSSMPDKDFMKHMRAVVDNFSGGEKGPPSQRKIQLLHYAASIASNPACATALIHCNLLQVAAQQIKECSNQDV